MAKQQGLDTVCPSSCSTPSRRKKGPPHYDSQVAQGSGNTFHPDADSYINAFEHVSTAGELVVRGFTFKVWDGVDGIATYDEAVC